jgi:hypothetical protein
MEIRYGRKKNGIRIELKKKIDDWINSIEDEDLRQVVAKNTIVTGGAIASMLLGEKVHDYDVYMKTKDAAKQLAIYYVSKFKELNGDKFDAMEISYQPIVKEETLKNIKGVEEERVVIYMKSAGVASETQEEYAYYEMRDMDDATEFAAQLSEEIKDSSKPRYRPIFLSQNAITLSDKMQIVIRFYGSPDEIHENYDFAHAKNYYDYDKNYLHLDPEALECLLSRTLIYRGSLYPIASIFRMKKFLERGWRISAGQQLKIMWQISEIDLKDHEVMREMLVGVDQAYLYQLVEALSKTDPEKIDSAYVSTIIDKIFD